MQHQLGKHLPGYVAVCGNKLDDTLLDAFKVIKGLGYCDNQPVHSHRMDSHGRGIGNKGAFGRHRQRHADGVTSPQHQRDGGLFHRGDELGNGKPCLHVTAHGIEEKEQTAHEVILLRIDEKGRYDFSKKDAYPKESTVKPAVTVDEEKKYSRPLRKAED